ncbi:MAG: hypothetical protein ACRENG_25475, partial [bacterium]
IYKCPRHVEFCESLPHSVTGKVLKRLLREKKPAPVVATETQPAAETGTSQVEVVAASPTVATVDDTQIEKTVDEVQSG